MKKNPKAVYLAVLYLLILATGIFFYILKPLLDLQNLLNDVSITNLQVDNQIYSLKNGHVAPDTDYKTKLQVLRLAAFYQWNKEDPLADSPDINPQGLERPIYDLDQAQQEFLKVTNYPQNLFPVELLKTLSNVSKSNKDFLANPSIITANLLTKSQLKFQENYFNAAHSYLTFFNQLPDNSLSISSEIGFNTQNSPKVTSDDYELITSNAQSLKAEILQRQKCLDGSGSCQRTILSLTKPRLQNYISKQIPPFLSKTAILKQYTEFEGESFDVEGPYRADTECFGWANGFSKPTQYFYYVSGKNFLDVPLATDMFFRPIPSTPNQFGIDNYLLNQGQKYTNQLSDAPYICTDTRYINEVYELHSFLKKQKPILQNLNVPEDAKIAEKEFFADPYPSYDELLQVGNYYGYLYRSVNEPIKDQLLNRYLDINRKMADFGRGIEREATFTMRPINLIKLSDLDPNFVYLTRSNYSFLYLTFSPSVWRLNTDPQYLVKRQVSGAISPQSGFISYTQALKLYPQSTIDQWFSNLNPDFQLLINEKNTASSPK